MEWRFRLHGIWKCSWCKAVHRRNRRATYVVAWQVAVQSLSRVAIEYIVLPLQSYSILSCNCNCIQHSTELTRSPKPEVQHSSARKSRPHVPDAVRFRLSLPSAFLQRQACLPPHDHEHPSHSHQLRAQCAQSRAKNQSPQPRPIPPLPNPPPGPASIFASRRRRSALPRPDVKPAALLSMPR